MSSIGTGYDLSASQFSPDGKVFQVEYAQKAVENSGTAVGIRGKNGVVFGVEKLIQSKLYEKEANKRIFHIDEHIGMAVAGLLADARQIADIAKQEASNYRSNYGNPIPCKVLADRVAMYMHAYTLYSFVRPFGCSVLLSGVDNNIPQLFTIEPSGICYGYHGCSVGKAKQAAKTEVEKVKMKDMTMRDIVKEVAKIIHIVHDELKDKAFDLEMSWIGEDTEGRHEMVPQDILEEAIKYAKVCMFMCVYSSCLCVPVCLCVNISIVLCVCVCEPSIPHLIQHYVSSVNECVVYLLGVFSQLRCVYIHSFLHS
ncbi:hypothetical protein HELRODRAFT_69441 [Helobdella robusta]|uniref:Proteasome alpha-type subunits domain-containing protein n=1 Tax=Helobdella robusta TaxID=6412 RepID=T1FZV4_HELRO|nr:hypothetical protein HELRODRAFT_69441 [Helobdella robusta]ESN93115.1 hypothetical protein HELRODRAFT_69441 [Helobdella robusta]